MEQKIKFGLVGASVNGGWSPVAHIPALEALDNIQLAALCTSRPESAKAASKAFEVDRVYSNYNDLVSQQDIDAVSVVVKIPNHYEIVKAALEAGKHVYCEWPLGASLEETEELAMLAKKKGLVTAMGLQGHHAPEFLYIKQLLEQGWFGQIVSVKMTMQTKASSTRASIKVWEDEKQRKATLFSIVGGHTLYYLSNIFGGFAEVAGQLTIRLKELSIMDTGEKVFNDVPDQISIQGLFQNGVPFLSQISAVPQHSKGWCLEVYGTEGTMIATSSMLPQITPIVIKGAKGDSAIQIMEVPKNLDKFNSLPQGPAGNVGRNYGKMAEAIMNEETFHPNFDDALMMHKLLETIKKSSEEKRTIKLNDNK